MNELKDYYYNKKVLVTGASGFVGGWLSLILKEIFSAKVFGIGLMPTERDSFFNSVKIEKLIDDFSILDVRSENNIKSYVNSVNPDIVFHLAAQPLVSESYLNPIGTFDTNVMGTLNILKSVFDTCSKTDCIIITSDKCYKNEENGKPFKETDPLGGVDPYSASKAACEIVSESFARSYFEESKKFKLSTARAGNIIGGGDWSRDRIITDILKSILSSKNLILRNPEAIRPWQHIMDAINGYLKIGFYMKSSKEAFNSFNFGPSDEDEMNVREFSQEFFKCWGVKNIETNLKKENNYESTTLRLNNNKSRKILGWLPLLNQRETIKWTVDWYKQYLDGKDIKFKSVEDASNFFEMINT